MKGSEASACVRACCRMSPLTCDHAFCLQKHPRDYHLGRSYFYFGLGSAAGHGFMFISSDYKAMNTTLNPKIFGTYIDELFCGFK